MTTEQREDVVELLLLQHEQVKQVLGKVRSDTGEAKRESFEELVRLLAVHETAEEEIVHPTARQVHVEEKIIDKRLAEESEAKHVLTELYDLGVDNPEFDKKFQDFADSVVEHAESEEEQEFAELRQQCSPEERARLATVLRAAEAVAPTRPHPDTGESMTANLLVGPPLAVFDRVRDAVRDWSRKLS